MSRVDGHMDMVAVALEPIHHGAGSVGNVQVLRRQEVLMEDGTTARVPYISGNSLRHMIRAGGARYAIEALGIGDGDLSKGMVDLLFSGGGLSKGGSAVNLSKARELERLFPLLSVMGYGAGNTMTQAKLRMNNMHLVCQENRFRMPVALLDHPHALRLRAAATRVDEFGTRHESTRDPSIARLLPTEQRALIEGERSAKASDKGASEKVKDTAQMIYEFETIQPGARFWCQLSYRDLSDLEIGALQSALGRACSGVHSDGGYIFSVGAKTNQGNGQVSITFSGVLHRIVRTVTEEAQGIVTLGDAGSPQLKAYTQHLQDNRQAVVAALREASE